MLLPLSVTRWRPSGVQWTCLTSPPGGADFDRPLQCRFAPRRIGIPQPQLAVQRNYSDRTPSALCGLVNKMVC